MNKVHTENKITAKIKNSKVDYASLTLHQQLSSRYIKHSLMLIIFYCMEVPYLGGSTQFPRKLNHLVIP
jgi:hypothetical protein